MALGVNGVAQSGGLPTASGAGQVPVSDGAGDTYTPTARTAVVGGGFIGITTGSPNGTTLIARDGGLDLTSPEVSAALAAPDAAGARTALDVYSTAEVDAAVAGGAGAATTVYDFAAATGFTTDNGVAGTAAVTAGVARLSNPAGSQYRTAAVGYQGPCIYRALPSPSTVDVAVRLAVGPSVVGTQVSLEISDAASAGTRICALVQQTRDVSIYRNDTNAIIATAGAAFAAFTGQEWVRVRAVPGFVTIYYGTGVAGALPTSWTRVGAALALSAFWSHVTMGLVVVATGAESTVDLDDLTVLSVPESSL